LFPFLLGLAGGALVAAGQTQDVVFRSDVSLVRVDAQVVDRENRAVTGLAAEDFVLLEEGRQVPVTSFGSEGMPVDVVLLLDVSGSMEPHVARIGAASHQALRVLGPDDRVAIMVFDRSSRLRLPFRANRADVEREFENLLRQETFDGGTDITRGILEAADYILREARRDARRAVVILTDDQTERDRNEAKVGRALAEADAVLCALIAPDAMPGLTRRRTTTPGGTWPGTGGPLGGPLGDIIFGPRRVPGGGSGPVYTGGGTRSAGTREIARDSGGDSMAVEDASALDSTLARIRQRYALHFYVPEGVKAGEERAVEVRLADAARRRYPDAQVRYRRKYISPAAGSGATGGGTPEPTIITQAPARRRPAVDGPVGQSVPSTSTGGWPKADTAAPKTTSTEPAPENPPAQGGWRRLKPGEQP
jgi:VWFA-related protein